MNYLASLLNQILNRRRKQLERRNDFIQIMVDHEKQIENEQETNSSEKQAQQWGTLKKSRPYSFHIRVFICSDTNFSIK